MCFWKQKINYNYVQLNFSFFFIPLQTSFVQTSKHQNIKTASQLLAKTEISKRKTNWQDAINLNCLRNACIGVQPAVETNLSVAPTSLLFETPFLMRYFLWYLPWSPDTARSNLPSAVDQQPKSPRKFTHRENASRLTMCVIQCFQTRFVFWESFGAAFLNAFGQL